MSTHSNPIRQCKQCNAPLPTSRTAYCGHECASAANKAKAGIPDHGLPTGTVGALHELVVSTELMRRGWHVFRALSPSCPCDLVVYRANSSMIRVEVRTGHRKVGGGTYSPLTKKDIGRHDVLAIVTHDGEISFCPDIL
jgi:hypothetical protein